MKALSSSITTDYWYKNGGEGDKLFNDEIKKSNILSAGSIKGINLIVHMQEQ